MPYLELLESALRTAPASETGFIQSLIQIVEMAGPGQMQRAVDVATWYEVRAPHIKVIEVAETDEIEAPQRPAPNKKSSYAMSREQRQREVAPYLSVLGKMKDAAESADKRTASILCQLVSLTPTEHLRIAAIVAAIKASQSVEGEGLKTAARKNASEFHKIAG
jgi:hypothetical protein